MPGRLFATVPLGFVFCSSLLNAQDPLITTVRNASSFAETLAPGTVSFIFGVNLSAQPQLCSAPVATSPNPTELCGARVLVNNTPSPLLFVSPSQISLQFPFGLNRGPAEISVEVEGRRSAAFIINITAYAPGLFTVGQTGQGMGLFIDANDNIVSEDNPPPPGAMITAIATGLGETIPPVPAGERPPDGSLPRTVTPPSFIIASNATPVISAIASAEGGNFLGLYEVDFVVPAGLVEGIYNATLTIGGFTSNTVQIPIGPVELTPCSYSLSPSMPSFSGQGGLNFFTVTTGPTCSWSAVSSVNWITIFQVSGKGTSKINYAIASNQGGARTGTIAIGGQVYTVNQQANICTYSIIPAAITFNNSGGNRSIAVAAPTGCAWTAVSNAGWLGVVSGASGMGSGSVTLKADPNAGGPRAGTATITGKTLAATQGAGACGALDVTSQTTLTRSGITWVRWSTYAYRTKIRVFNRSRAMISAAQLILIGLRSGEIGFGFVGLEGSHMITFCFSPGGDYRIPLGDLQPGQYVDFPFTVITDGVPGIPTYSARVLSGEPNK